MDESSWSKVIFARFLNHLGDEKLVAKAKKVLLGGQGEACKVLQPYYQADINDLACTIQLTLYIIAKEQVERGNHKNWQEHMEKAKGKLNEFAAIIKKSPFLSGLFKKYAPSLVLPDPAEGAN